MAHSYLRGNVATIGVMLQCALSHRQQPQQRIFDDYYYYYYAWLLGQSVARWVFALVATHLTKIGRYSSMKSIENVTSGAGKGIGK